MRGRGRGGLRVRQGEERCWGEWCRSCWCWLLHVAYDEAEREKRKCVVIELAKESGGQGSAKGFVVEERRLRKSRSRLGVAASSRR